MERLTEHYEYPNGQHGYRAKGYGIIEQRPFFGIIKRLAEYEDAEEQGLLIRLPCKVGDTVWMLTKTLDINAGTMKDDIIPASITQLRGNKLNPIWYIAESKNDARDFHPSSIGKTVFLTREAAEAALKGRINHGK